MGNVQGRVNSSRLASAALSCGSRTEDVLALVRAEPFLLTSKSRALQGSIFHHAAQTGNAGLLEGLLREAVAT